MILTSSGLPGGPLGGLLGRLGGLLGALEVSWAVLEASWSHLGRLGSHLGRLGGILEAILGHQGGFESHLEQSWESFGGNCGPFGWPAGWAEDHQELLEYPKFHLTSNTPCTPVINQQGRRI